MAIVKEQKVFQKLEPSFKKKWLEALRSGKYKQTDGKLCDIREKDNPKYCCLGVAVCVLGEKWGRNGIRQSSGTIPVKLAKKVGLHSRYSENESMQEYLSNLNDDYNWNSHRHNWKFNRIANWIEKNL